MTNILESFVTVAVGAETGLSVGDDDVMISSTNVPSGSREVDVNVINSIVVLSETCCMEVDGVSFTVVGEETVIVETYSPVTGTTVGDGVVDLVSTSD